MHKFTRVTESTKSCFLEIFANIGSIIPPHSRSQMSWSSLWTGWHFCSTSSCSIFTFNKFSIIIYPTIYLIVEIYMFFSFISINFSLLISFLRLFKNCTSISISRSVYFVYRCSSWVTLMWLSLPSPFKGNWIFSLRSKNSKYSFTKNNIFLFSFIKEEFDQKLLLS